MSTLTRIRLDETSPRTMRALASAQIMHAIVEGGTGEGRALWRVDRTEAGLNLLIVSDERPDAAHFESELGVTDPGVTWRDYAPVLSHLEEGQRWAFRVTVNPTRTIRKTRGEGEKPERGHRVPIRGRDEQLRWLIDKAPGAGFVVDAGMVQQTTELGFKREGVGVRLTTATIEGVLIVTDAEALRETMTNGIGRARAYGCGMLTLARP